MQGCSVFGVDLNGGIYQVEGYKNIAAAVVKLAADDLNSAYMRIKKWEERGRLGRLALTKDQKTAVNFFKDGNPMQELYLSMLGIDELPSKIIHQRDVVLKTGQIADR